MRPSPQQLAKLCDDVDAPWIERHLSRLADAYFDHFDLDQIAAHLRAAAALSVDRPVVVLTDARPDGRLSLTVLSHDYPGVFSLITGTLAGLGFGIQSGHVFTDITTTSPDHSPRPKRKPLRRHRRPNQPAHRRRIIDQFIGELDTDVDPDTFAARLTGELTDLVQQLQADPNAGPAAARHRVNELVTGRLRHLADDRFPRLYPVNVDVTVGDDGLTHMRITAQDTPAFLYSLSNALSMMGMSIEAVRADTAEGMVEDDIGFVDSAGAPVTDPATLDRVKLAVLLTKQFTYYLDKSPDPYTALQRFEQLAQDVLRQDDSQWWTRTLADPKAMQRLARLLGASDYLWEDFIRLQYEALRPILLDRVAGDAVSHDTDSIPIRLAAELARANTLEQKRDALNRFKNHEVYLIDLDQILHPGTDFRTFSHKLSALADAVINAAAELAYKHLVEQHGQPIDAKTHRPCPWTICGLGKLGGEALGYASDIELLFVYDGAGQTDGDDAIHVGEFFNRLGKEVSQTIRAKQEGIFRVDLRVRPYGKNAPLATSLQTVRKYHAPGGDGMAWERMALVRLRPIAGDTTFGRRVSDVRDELVYSGVPLPLEELWQMRRMQWQQKRGSAGQFNAKYSPGALVDVEYAVQIQQVTHGHDHADLRTPRIHEALAALAAAKVLEGDDAVMLTNAYRFMRELINGLRMLRGSAKDLFVPTMDSLEFTYLARRLGYEGDDAAKRLQADLDYHADAVRKFVVHCYGEAAQPDRPGHE